MDRFPAVTQGCLYAYSSSVTGTVMTDDTLHVTCESKLMVQRIVFNITVTNTGILEYTGERILLQAKTCQVCLEGTRLSIDYYTNEDMKISGNISALRYLRE